MTSLLMRSFGPDYSCQPNANFLYKSDRVRDENEHSGGMLSYRQKRLIVIEELDPSKALDEQLLKKLNGEKYMNRGRLCSSPVIKSYPWITKMILCCNEGNVPHFDVTDHALIDRILAIPHRARFYPTKLAYERAISKQISYSYMADSSIRERFDEWRPYMMKFCVEGLKRYWMSRFSAIPTSFSEYAESVVAERNTPVKFLEEKVIQTGHRKDFVSRGDLFADFEMEHRTQQKDKKTRVDKSKFFQILLDYLGEDCHRAKSNGRRDVFVGWRMQRMSDDTSDLEEG